MNKVILMGRFTRDPESRMTGANMEVSRFSLACSNDFTNRNGEREAEFINCVAFGNTANAINRFCTKGSALIVQGRIRNGSYDAQDGTKRYTTDVVVDSFEFAGSRPAGSAASAPSSSNYDMPNFDAPTPRVESVDVSVDPYKDFGNEINDDDLPF